MGASILLAVVMKLHLAISLASDQHIADFVMNLSDLDGKGGTEINYITDLSTSEERGVYFHYK